MRNLTLIFLLPFLFACSSQKETAKKDNNPQVKVKKEGRKMYGTIVSKYVGPMLSEDWDETKRPLFSFFVDNEYYLIKIEQGGVSLKQLNELEGKEIKVRATLVGEGWTGLAMKTLPSKKAGTAGGKDNKMGHIIIHEVLEIL